MLSALKYLGIVSIIIASGCAKYQQHFGGRSADYKTSVTTEKLVYPAGIKGLQPSDRYSIPNVCTTETQEVDLTPPEY